MKKENYTISAYTENNIGLLNRISSIFSKRHINLDSLTTSVSEIKDVYRFTIVVQVTEDQARKLVGQIEKQIEVIKAFYHKDEETIFQETALFKMASKLLFEDREIQLVIKEHIAHIVTVTPEYFVLEKTGSRQEVELLYDRLEPYGLMQFVRSGRIAITKDKMHISKILENFSIASS
ncbi:acetolactate synthase small subunit [Aquimarina intermedia]|uniref:Acetolactate synthase small subunit n=1 Tax=Aquimarina intermedia TaxID=350814 RepID=A0A5S5BYR5_9FLAO|nr:acetolactate synthase small subunit [Aquimarina intermedia]TYP72184.1 acetolactate synthase small subunit [Aquimarina intermedia]